jgi:hypothetical protein
LENDPLRLIASSPSLPASPLTSSTSSGSGPNSGASTPTSSSRPGSGETKPYKMRVRSAGRAPPRVDITNIASPPPLQSPPDSLPGDCNDPTTPPPRPRRGNGVPVVVPIGACYMLLLHPSRSSPLLFLFFCLARTRHHDRASDPSVSTFLRS